MADEHPEAFEKVGEPVRLDKMTAARRQLNSAIWLWFKEGDPASIHTLTGAAFGILDALYYRKFKRRPVPLNEVNMPEYLRPHAKKLRDLISLSQDYLKHARYDADESHDLPVGFTDHYIYGSIRAYWELNPREWNQPLMS